ncbi:hypothetical protein [Kozakia baliensis]|uniref:Uncharacterized protein n=1 Tax=Kozakia baliensis TaxID=153496 RepID=A0A1D8UUK3_9PROT|nr:hypothetical protein [Kozakia baliensis]AOX17320.1 hypothetical protein A0U89_09440 [Kozakia baliensis]GBR30064.1 hypothetical protein AA0488_1882 [Kozakia baliensis NRIC 0488]GEL63245.1 hypothetical protein KBA01_05310 [Kozakia baliensis]
MASTTFIAIFDNARHAQAAVEDLVASHIPSACIRYCEKTLKQDPDEVTYSETEASHGEKLWAGLYDNDDGRNSHLSRCDSLPESALAPPEATTVTVLATPELEEVARRVLVEHMPVRLFTRASLSEAAAFGETVSELAFTMSGIEHLPPQVTLF